MKAVETSSAIPPEVMADLEHAVQLAMTGEKDPEFEARIQAESEKITEEIRRKHGVLNIAVGRDSLPALATLLPANDLGR